MTDLAVAYIEMRDEASNQEIIFSTKPAHLWLYIALISVPVSNTALMHVPNSYLLPLCPMRLEEGNVALVCTTKSQIEGFQGIQQG